MGTVAFTPAAAASKCKGLTQSKCKSNSSCAWVKAHKRKGKTVNAFCRAKGKKGITKAKRKTNRTVKKAKNKSKKVKKAAKKTTKKKAPAKKAKKKAKKK